MVHTDLETANALPDRDYVIGDHCDDTAGLPLSDVAKRPERGILDVQGDDLIAAEAASPVTTDESGPQGIMRVTVDGAPSLTDLRVTEGLAREDAVLIADGGIQAVPMRMPPGAWALLVTAADRLAATGEVVLFAGQWCEHEYPASGCRGDLIVQLASPTATDDESDAVCVRLAVADGDRWIPAGTWPRRGHDWPEVVAPAAAAIMGAYIDAAEVAPPVPPPMQVIGRGRVSLRDLLAAGLVDAGEQLVYWRPGLGVHRTGQLTAEGLLRLDDGRLFTNPSAATTALGSPHQNGWQFWCRVSDGRTLWDLRSEYKSTMDARDDQR
ncbi:hypothetical protein HFP15_03785 [Amycolatopsis sp. K13G38]|uniref:RAMA domain-containing protein n=1 Tax=Amycolatopsis acididurans TaxID=2724524 RepID=A0ABX1IWY1_9PSEU|nr:hypothetical protein [Amycolatopsis acididurans]NKQ51998.1 hypothetical protein [Amycolatopsis acididurans]